MGIFKVMWKNGMYGPAWYIGTGLYCAALPCISANVAFQVQKQSATGMWWFYNGMPLTTHTKTRALLHIPTYILLLPFVFVHCHGNVSQLSKVILCLQTCQHPKCFHFNKFYHFLPISCIRPFILRFHSTIIDVSLSFFVVLPREPLITLEELATHIDKP